MKLNFTSLWYFPEEFTMTMFYWKQDMFLEMKQPEEYVDDERALIIYFQKLDEELLTGVKGIHEDKIFMNIIPTFIKWKSIPILLGKWSIIYDTKKEIYYLGMYKTKGGIEFIEIIFKSTSEKKVYGILKLFFLQ